jgi:hypothetical protein
LIEGVPIFEKIDVITSSFDFCKEKNSYSSVFQIIGKMSKTVYDQVEVELSNFSFLQKVTSVESYLKAILKLRYSGFLSSFDDIEHYSTITNKPMINNRTMKLDKIKEMPSLEGENYKQKVRRIAHHLEIALKGRDFEVTYELNGTKQSYFCFYEKDEEINYLIDLIDRTKTHNITLRVIDNDLLEVYQIAKGLYQPKIRKSVV